MIGVAVCAASSWEGGGVGVGVGDGEGVGDGAGAGIDMPPSWQELSIKAMHEIAVITGILRIV
ncbi:MAG: hypothetical protein ACTHKR_10880 [Sphingomonas sp.]